MKERTEKILSSIIDSGVFISNIAELFDIYTENEIKTYEDIFECKRDFANYINSIKHKFLDYSENKDFEIKRSAASVEIYVVYYGVKFSKHVRLESEKFSDIVLKIAKKNGLNKILDVGCGQLALSSIYLAKNGLDVTCVDPELAFSNKTFENLGVKAIKGLFEDVDLSEFDLIIAKKPCPSIKEIVFTCDLKNVPFFVELCDCNAPNGNKFDWIPILESGSKTKHFGEFVYSPMLKINEDDFNLGQGDKTLHDVIMQRLL
ncbi:MAG: hypothetical protein K6F08_02595 [bacterium]|nr:hypothetical protein [bacterium]